MPSDVIQASIAAACVSVSASTFVILTPLLFRKMRGKLFMQIIASISIGDWIGNFPYMFPFRPNTGNWWCSIQGFMNFFGYPVEWMWTVALTYLLYRIAIKGSLPSHIWVIRAICWLLPLILAVSALAFGRYTRSAQPAEVCATSNSVGSIVYHAVAYYGLLVFCMLALFYLYLRIFLAEHVYKTVQTSSASFAVAKSALRYYPILLAVFWIPHGITAAAYHNELWYDVFLVWKIFHGVAVAIVFFSQSQESRRLWWEAGLALWSGQSRDKQHLLDDQNCISSVDSTVPIDVDDVLENRTYLPSALMHAAQRTDAISADDSMDRQRL